MTGKQRCEEILRLIDAVLGEAVPVPVPSPAAILAPAVATDKGHRPAR